MSDKDFEGTDEESMEDFSGSEDEWKPNNTKGKKSAASTDEDEEEDEEVESSEGVDDEDFESPPPKKFKNPTSGKLKETKKNIRKIKKFPQNVSLRAKMYKKYRPPPKTAIAPKSTIAQKSNIAENSDSDSGSSVDNCLVNPDKIDLKASFFDVQSTSNGGIKSKEPVFECDAGMNFADSESENEMEEVTTTDKTNVNAFKKFFDYNKNAENAKDQIKNMESKMVAEKNVDVSLLLAMGENKKPTNSKIEKKNITKPNEKMKKNVNKHSDSDWEEVAEHKILQTTSKEGILQVTVALPQTERREKKVTDEQASFVRQLNRLFKENYLIFHKVSLLCHIAHGNYLNRALNNPSLMASALQLLPSKRCYPDGRTEIKYFESLIKWYKSAVVLESFLMNTKLKKRPPIPLSLAIQIKYKAAICKKDFILIFIILLRAMGIQCRLIVNLVPLPLKPLQSDLCTVNPKNSTENNKKKATIKPKKNSSAKDVKTNTKIDKNAKKPPEIVKEKRKVIDVPSPRKTRKTTREAQKNNNDHKPNTIITKTKQTENKTKTDVNENSSKLQTKIKKNTNAKRSSVVPTVKISTTKNNSSNSTNKSRSPSPKFFISPHFTQTKTTENDKPPIKLPNKKVDNKSTNSNRSPSPKFHISPHFTQAKLKDEMPSTSKDKKLTSKSKTVSSSTRITRNTLSVPQVDGSDDNVVSKSKSTNVKKRNSTRPSYSDSDSNSDDDFAISPPKKQKASVCPNKSITPMKRDRRILSTDVEDSPSSKKINEKAIDIWVEVFSEMEEKWVTIDLFNSKVHSIDSIMKTATKPISYVFAWNNDNSLKDVSARYCPQWNTVTRKMRVEKEWLNEAIRGFLGKKNVRDKAEDCELDKIHLDKPLPTSISEYKNHPLYALERHLLKFEGIYPPNAITLGFVRGEAVYPRDCVHTLHSREIWLKSARVVKPKQQPYKIVKARPKWDKVSRTVIKDLPLEIFGYWQTMDYEPPTAENGIVPRNAYGNVELFKECMLPKKTVHLKLPGLQRVCRKLGIDCAQAVIGFDFHQGSCHPLIDGFVICEEYKEQAIEAWNKDQEEIERREEEKYEQRVYGNWKKLIKFLLIKQKLKTKYNF